MKVSAERLEEIAARTKAASPGPWEVDGRCIELEDDATRPGLAILFVAADDEVPASDLAFVAHARQDVADLTDDLREARERIVELEHAVRYRAEEIGINSRRATAQVEELLKLVNARTPDGRLPPQVRAALIDALESEGGHTFQATVEIAAGFTGLSAAEAEREVRAMLNTDKSLVVFEGRIMPAPNGANSGGA